MSKPDHGTYPFSLGDRIDLVALLTGLYTEIMREPKQEAADSVAELIAWLFCQPNPIPLDTALAMCGLTKPVFRLPYVPLNRAERERGLPLLRDALPHLTGVQSINLMNDEDFICI